MPNPVPGPGELRICISSSGINPGDTKKREDTFEVGMPYPRVIPHSDGARQVDKVGGWRLFGVAWAIHMVLWRPIVSPLWYCRWIYSRPGSASSFPSPERDTGAGCMPWHPRHHGSSRRQRGRAGQWTYGSRTRSGGVRRIMRRSTSALRGSSWRPPQSDRPVNNRRAERH
jgi:hypothetical protein